MSPVQLQAHQYSSTVPQPLLQRPIPNGKTKSPAIPSPYSNWNTPRRYEIRSLLGVGSYGLVCEAVDLVTGKKVAVKKIPHTFDELIDCKRVLREIAILSRLRHKNVVRLIDVTIPGNPFTFEELYLVLELANSDLKKLIKTPVYLTEFHVQVLLYNLLLGLQYIHSCGIFHRDLKPANCLVNEDCCVKICDFGLARTVGSPKELRLLNDLTPDDAEDAALYGDVIHDRKARRQLTSHVVTRWYRAPELILLQDNYTEAIDVWSVGCIFAELLGMMKTNVPSYLDRSPIFPGNSCFPLSPDQKQQEQHWKWLGSRGSRDQLSVIFDVLGSPSAADISVLEKTDTKKYVRLFPQRPGINLAAKFPGASLEAMALLRGMLTFNPRRRITVADALAAPFFHDARRHYSEVNLAPQTPIRLPFDDWKNMSESELRYSFLREAQQYHPDLVIPTPLLDTIAAAHPECVPLPAAVPGTAANTSCCSNGPGPLPAGSNVPLAVAPLSAQVPLTRSQQPAQVRYYQVVAPAGSAAATIPAYAGADRPPAQPVPTRTSYPGGSGATAAAAAPLATGVPCMTTTTTTTTTFVGTSIGTRVKRAGE